MEWLLYLACADGESVSASTYALMHTTIDVDGLHDMIEMKAVHASWSEASYENAELEAKRRAESR